MTQRQATLAMSEEKFFFVEKTASFWNVDSDKLPKFKIDILDANLIYS